MQPIRRRAAALLALVLLADVGWGAFYIQRTSFERDGSRVYCLWDDAMISMTYARNWVEGFGLVWNPGGERVQGITNLGVTIVMAATHLLPLDPETASLPFQVLNLAALAGIVLLVWSAARRGFGSEAVAAGAAGATLLCAPLHLWSLQGSDTGAVALWLLVAVARLAAARGRWPRGLFAWLALGILIRPDFALFYAVFLALSPTFGAGAARRAAVGACVLLAAAAGLLAFGWLYYGDPLPNTVYLKATGSPRSLVLEAGLWELRFWLLGAVTSLPLAALAAIRHWRLPVVRVSAGLVAAALAYNVWVGGDWKGEYGSRYITPVLPLLLLLVAGGARELIESTLASFSPRQRAAAAFALTLATALLTSPQLALRDWFDPRAPTMLRYANERNFDAARYLRANTLPSTTLGVHYGGVPPYFSERRAVDVLGKSDRHIARLEVDRFIPGHSKWDWDYILDERKPDVFLSATRGLAQRGDFRRSYVVVQVSDMRLYLRRESLHKLTDRDAALYDPITGRRLDRGRRTARPGGTAAVLDPAARP